MYSIKLKKFSFDKDNSGAALILISEYSLDDYFVESGTITKELEFDNIFEFIDSSSEINLLDNSVLQSEFTTANLISYVYGIEIADDGYNLFTGQVLPNTIYYDESNLIWNLEARGWYKFALEAVKDKRWSIYYSDLENFLLLTFFNLSAIIQSINVNVDNDGAWDTDDQDYLISNFTGEIFNTGVEIGGEDNEVYVLIDLSLYNTSYRLRNRTIRGYNSDGQPTEAIISSYEEVVQDIPEVPIWKFITGGFDNGKPAYGTTVYVEGYSHFFNRDHLLYEAQKHYGAYVFIDENYTLQFIGRNQFISDTVDINDKIIEGGFVKQLSVDNEYNGIIISQKTTEGILTEISWRAIYYDSEGALHTDVILSEGHLDSIDPSLKLLDLRQKFSVSRDGDANPIRVYAGFGFRVFPQREIQSLLNDYKTLFKAPLHYECEVLVGSDGGFPRSTYFDVKLLMPMQFGEIETIAQVVKSEFNLSSRTAKLTLRKIPENHLV